MAVSEERHGGAMYARLSVMMFLEFAVWGAWSVMIAVHMGGALQFTGIQIGLVFGTTALGAILAPMIAGNIADRWVPSQVFTAISHLVGAALLFAAWMLPTFFPPPLGGHLGALKVTTFGALYTVMLLYSLTYMPTIALTNAIAFKHMGDSDKFGQIRVWGTLGWIAVQVGFAGYLKAMQGSTHESHAGDCLLFAAVVALLMGLYSFTLPDTPPSRDARNPYAFLEAFKLTRNRNFMILLVVSFVVAIELPWYYNLTPMFFTEARDEQQLSQQWLEQAGERAEKEGLPAPTAAPPILEQTSTKLGGLGLQESETQLASTIGQIAEISLMLLLWPMLRIYGMKVTIFFGILAWPLRYIAFSVGEPTWLVLSSQALHGIAYTFFFAAGMVAAERLAPKDIRASAQSLMLFATNGCGMLVGHFLSGHIDDLNRHQVMDSYLVGGQELMPPQFLHNWPGTFLLPIAVTLLAAAAFAFLFNQPQYAEDTAKIKAEEYSTEVPVESPADEPAEEPAADGAEE